ncbi:hypothetical protein F0895_23570 [Salmonella enterica]|uniref:Uncharacterized protein n=1 Tax=Salmonella enterica TaxID=28901 RepID=A0A5V1MSS9_SALER|nr:hypothetical protein [Salmonella enterica]EBG9531547.1 hypothetical protein [Salmonella enterica]EBT2118778.1 hypothetical protein [Salmonella enterica]ECR0747039.1 hypothetical protein [Salmonella enterica]
MSLNQWIRSEPVQREKVTPAAVSRPERSDRVSEEASLLRYRHKPPYAPVLHNTPARDFPDNPVRGTILSQYTLR